MSMLIGALMTVALAQAPASSGYTRAGWLMPRAGPRPASRSFSGTGILQHPVLWRAMSDLDGTFRIEVPPEKDPSGPNSSWGSVNRWHRRG